MSTNVDQDKTDDNIPTEGNELTTEDNQQTTAATDGDNHNQDDATKQQPQPESSSLAVDSNAEQQDNSNVEHNDDTVESQDQPHDQNNSQPGEEQTQPKDENEVENIDENPESRQSNLNSKSENVEEGEADSTARTDAENVENPNPDTGNVLTETTNEPAADGAEEENNNNQEEIQESTNETGEVTRDVEEEAIEDTDNINKDENVAENEKQPEVPDDKETHEESIHQSGRNSPTIPPLAERLDDDFNNQPDVEAPIDDLDARQTPTSDYYDEDTPSRSNSDSEEHNFYEDDVETSKEDEEIAIPKFDRAFLLEQYQMAYTERDQVNTMNLQLQHKLAEHFRKKKTEEKQDLDRNITDQEQRYLKYMSTLEELHKEETRVRENIKEQIEDLVKKRDDKHDKVSQARNEFMGFKKDVAKNALNSRSGKAIQQKDIDQYVSLELRKDHEVMQVRLENIKSKNKLKKREMQLKQKEELAEGLHLIDFEQLKIENQTYNEKIEERNEEILKLRKKITSTVQVLTHVKEKLQFVQAETSELKDDLQKVEVQVAQKRDILSRNKQVRDALRIENVKLREKCGLLGNEPLLRDYEEKKDEADYLLMRLEQLKMTHAELTLKCNGVRQKIEQSRSAPTYG